MHLTVPIAPLTSPLSVHRLVVSITLAPSAKLILESNHQVSALLALGPERIVLMHASGEP